MKICLSCEGVTDTQAHRCGYCDAPLLSTDSVHYPARRGELDAGNPLLGTVIDGKYRLQSVLGRGGLGTVFRAQHIGSLVTVALKLLHPRFSEKPEYRRSLLPEARRAATVNIRPRVGSSSGPTSFAVGIGLFGITSRWTGACGWISRNAVTNSS